MGRRFKKKGKGKKGGGKPRRENDSAVKGDDYVKMIVDQGNFKMEVYYAVQGLHNTRWDGDKLLDCTTSEEKDAERMLWRNTAVSVIPTSFRIAKDVPLVLRERIESELKSLLEEIKGEFEGDILKQLKFLDQAYQLSMDRKTIRKEPKLTKLHEWLQQQTHAGFITRQELVSMIPPVVLNPKPDDKILDMCAAPGSKTSQLLEDLGPAGCIVANDANASRAHMLVTQLRRIMHMNPQVLVTCCDGKQFPAVTQFDRILCDVPCSGDGTSRKNISVWKSWSQQGAMALHALQLSIAWKGAAELLEVGGHMCYSTCSNNPTENEAVVAELLRRSEGKLELVECSLEGFKTRPGWSTWKVMCEEMTELQLKNKKKKNNAKMQARRKEFEEKQAKEAVGESTPEETSEKVKEEGNEAMDEVKAEREGGEPLKEPRTTGEVEEVKPRVRKEKPRFKPESMDEEALIAMAEGAGLKLFNSPEDVPEVMQKRVKESTFPPTEEEVKSFHLERCLRCVPQDNDTGGFFVALLRKAEGVSGKDRRVAAKKDGNEPVPKKLKPNDDEETDDVKLEADRKEGRPARNPVGGGKGRDDFVSVGDDMVDPLIDLYGLTAGDFKKDLLMTRASGKGKIIYYVAKTVKDLVDMGMQDRVTVINTGLKAFSRSSLDGENSYRMCQESAHFLQPHMTKRKFVVSLEDFQNCLTDDRFVQITAFSEGLQTKLKELSVGSLVFVLDGYEDSLDQKLVACMWRCRTDRLDRLVSKVEVEAIRTKLNALADTEKSKE